MIDLDLTLEAPNGAMAVLSEILNSFAGQVGYQNFADEHVTSASLRLLVFASGGVARDFLELLCRAIDQMPSDGSQVEPGHVVAAVGDYWTLSKLPALREETAVTEASRMEIIFNELRRLCIQEIKSPIFGVTRSEMAASKEIANAILDLVDLKFLHLLNRSAEVEDRTEEASIYLLDLSAFSLLDANLSENGIENLIFSPQVKTIPVSHMFMVHYVEVLLSSLESRSDASEAVTLRLSSTANPARLDLNVGRGGMPTESRPDIAGQQPERAYAADRASLEALPKVRSSQTIAFTVGGAEGLPGEQAPILMDGLGKSAWLSASKAQPSPESWTASVPLSPSRSSQECRSKSNGRPLHQRAF